MLSAGVGSPQRPFIMPLARRHSSTYDLISCTSLSPLLPFYSRPPPPVETSPTYSTVQSIRPWAPLAAKCFGGPSSQPHPTMSFPIFLYRPPIHACITTSSLTLWQRKNINHHYTSMHYVFNTKSGHLYNWKKYATNFLLMELNRNKICTVTSHALHRTAYILPTRSGSKI